MPSPSANPPFVSVVVVCFNEIKNIQRCLQSLVDLKYDPNKYEILVVDNTSIDGTQEILKKFERTLGRSRFRWKVNPVKGIAVSRNIGLKEATHDLVAFTDADCEVPPQWLTRLADGFTQIAKADSRVIAVGGANLPPEYHSRFYDALTFTLQTYLGNRGSTQGKVFDKITSVPHMPTVNILYDRRSVLKEGGFDESYGAVCEDPELHHRLIKNGHTIYFVPECHVWHYMRDNLLDYGLNILKYGRGRIRIIKKHPDHFSPIYIFPPLLIAMITIGNILGLYMHEYFFVNFYFLLLYLYSFFICAAKHKVHLVKTVFLIYVVTHFAYGLGELKGLFSEANESF